MHKYFKNTIKGAILVLTLGSVLCYGINKLSAETKQSDNKAKTNIDIKSEIENETGLTPDQETITEYDDVVLTTEEYSLNEEEGKKIKQYMKKNIDNGKAHKGE